MLRMLKVDIKRLFKYIFHLPSSLKESYQFSFFSFDFFLRLNFRDLKMPNKIKNTLTRREQRCLIDFDSISPNRHDYALILFCSRILVRVQLKCFEESANDVNDIVRKEAEYFPSRLQGFAFQMRQYGYAYNL